MKNFLFIMLLVSLTFVSCSLSNEEKAEKLVKQKIITNLYHQDSYKAVSTKVDSAFVDFEKMGKFSNAYQELRDLLFKQNEYEQSYSHALSSKGIYDPKRNSYYYDEHDKLMYEKYTKECEDLQKKLQELPDKIDKVLAQVQKLSSSVFTEEQTGWFVFHKFTAKDYNNLVDMPGFFVFICNLDFTKCGDAMEYEMFNRDFEVLHSILEATSDDEIKEYVIQNINPFEYP